MAQMAIEITQNHYTIKLPITFEAIDAHICVQYMISALIVNYIDPYIGPCSIQLGQPKQEDQLNACWNSVYRKLFGFHRWESLKYFILRAIGRLDLHHVIRIQRIIGFILMFYIQL